MRRLVPLVLLVLLVLLLAACTGTAEDTTTTPLAGPSTTTTTTAVPSTTTTEPTTTTIEEECTERDGVFRDQRGFVCPPSMRSLDLDSAPFSMHRPGRYTSRQFTPKLTFSRGEPFGSQGENPTVIVFDSSAPADTRGIPATIIANTPATRAIVAFGGDLGEAFARLPDTQPSANPDGDAWYVNRTQVDLEVAGRGARMTSFTVRCLDFGTPCSHDFALPGLERWQEPHDRRTAIVEVESPETLTILIAAPKTAFDTYWTEVAQPIFDSIEFIDP